MCLLLECVLANVGGTWKLVIGKKRNKTTLPTQEQEQVSGRKVGRGLALGLRMKLSGAEDEHVHRLTANYKIRIET